MARHRICSSLNILLLLHSSFMLCVLKMPLKREVGGHEITSFMENHGIEFFEFLWERCVRRD